MTPPPLEMNPQTMVINLDRPGERLDRALAAARPDISRAQWQRLIKEACVTLDGRPVKASQRLEGGESLVVVLPPVVDTELQPEAIPLEILYEDADLLVVNKPAGMVVHPAAGHDHGTLVNAILAHCPDLPGVGGERRPGIVHRLDKDTSGIILVAKHDAALTFLQRQFKQRTVQKTYLALVEGHLTPAEALIDAPLGRDPRQRKQMAVIPPGGSATARPSQTRYLVLDRYDEYTLVACYPLTGRTHQIRVHLAFAGHPIVGDKVYGRRKQPLGLDRHFLHAAEIAFTRPGGQAMHFKVGLPPELQQLLDTLAKSES